ncbi:MAG: HAD hydrolase family protein [Actinomycetaceae bacterium]|nr:HAD hydrolase family protein [Actinomycetaceae bacterium]
MCDTGESEWCEFAGALRASSGSVTAPPPRVQSSFPVPLTDTHKYPYSGGASDLSGGTRLEVPAQFSQVEPEKWLVALDIDGTLLGTDGSITPATLVGVQSLDRAGAHVVIATGRSIPAVAGVLEILQLRRGYVVCSNGAVTIEVRGGQAGRSNGGRSLGEGDATGGRSKLTYRVVRARIFAPAQIIRRLVQAVPGALLGVEVVGQGFRVSAPFPPGELIGLQDVVGLEALGSEPVTRVILRTPEFSAQQLRDLVSQVDFAGLQWDIGWNAWLDVTSADSGKGAALADIARSLGVARDLTVAVGDGQNDLSMIEWAGWGLAMANARPEVQGQADAILPSAAQSGVGVLVNALLSGAK